MVRIIFCLILFCSITEDSLASPRVSTRGVNTRGFEDIIKDKLLPRKPVDIASLGINAFANDSQFGSISSQFLEVRDTLGIKYIRVLMAWDDGAQSRPNATPNFSFYDKLMNNIPNGVEAIVVITGVPSWMKNKKNWIDGNPRKTFAEKWVKVVADRYKSNSRVVGLQIWNEPNMTANPHNSLLGVANSPQNFVELLKFSRAAMKAVAPDKIMLNGATTAINQNYPASLSYNRQMKAAGAENYIDIWAAHFYGKSVENIIRPAGVGSFLRTSGKQVWITEAGEKGINNQREYVERYFTYLRKNVKKISRIYFYQFTENSPASSTYGLRNPTKGLSISDFYIYLRDKKASTLRR